MDLLIPIALIIVGIGLVVAEVYLIPGFNVIGIIGLGMLVLAVVLSFTELGLIGGIIALFSSLGLLGFVFTILWRSGAWDRFILRTNLEKDENLIAREGEDRAKYLGNKGIAVTPLRPTGIAEISGERIEVITEGEFIAAGSDIEVVAIARQRYYVRLANAPSKQVTG